MFVILYNIYLYHIINIDPITIARTNISHVLIPKKDNDNNRNNIMSMGIR